MLFHSPTDIPANGVGAFAPARERLAATGLDRALSTALTNVAGGTNAREQVAALNSLLPGIDVHLSAARKASSAATAQFVKDTEAAMKAPKNANTRAIAKAEASGVKADQAAKTL